LYPIKGRTVLGGGKEVGWGLFFFGKNGPGGHIGWFKVGTQKIWNCSELKCGEGLVGRGEGSGKLSVKPQRADKVD